MVLLDAKRTATAMRGAQVLFALLAIALFCVIVVVPRAVGGRSLTVLSGSMSPTYPVGSTIVVRPVAPSEITEGDAITFANGSGSVTTHRVVALRSDGGETEFVTQGDANELVDKDPVPASAVRGRVWFHVPFLGHVHHAIASPRGLAAILGTALLVAAWDPGRRVLTKRRSGSARLSRGTRKTRSVGVQADTTTDVPVQQLLITQVGLRDDAERRLVAELATNFNGQLISLAHGAATMAFVGPPERLTEVESSLSQENVIRAVRSNPVALAGDAATSDPRSEGPASSSPLSPQTSAGVL